MRNTCALTICTVLLAAVSSVVAQAPAKKAPAGPGLTLTTTAFADGGIIPNKFSQADPNPATTKRVVGTAVETEILAPDASGNKKIISQHEKITTSHRSDGKP